MSQPSAIAAVTATLRNLLLNTAHEDPELLDTTVTTQPPGLARNGNDANQLNLFLYNATVNTAFSNRPMPGQIKNGESGIPPLALTLKYLITAYGRNDDDVNGHRLMGRAIAFMHDFPILGRAEIEAALPDANLHNQVERVRITADSLSLDDMSKLWTSFQTEYRISSGFEVSVVLIESRRAAKTPLPVLRRGEEDRGAAVQENLTPPYPSLSEIVLPDQQPSILLGDTFTLKGHHFDGDTVVIRFAHPRLADPIDLPALAGGSDKEITAQIPNNPADWMSGFYTLEVLISRVGEPDRSTNTLPLPLAPRIESIAPANPVVRDGSGNVTLTLTCSPEIRPEQDVRLLLGDREVLAQAHPAQSAAIDFLVENAPEGERFIRLRVDGLDSLLFDRSLTPPVFDENMKVNIT